MANERIRVGVQVTISRRGKKGTWTAEFWANGQHRRQSLKTSNKKVAMTKAVALDKELSEGTFQQPSRNTLMRPAIQQYIGDLETNSRARKTIVRYRGELRTFCDFCEERRVTRLSGVTALLFDAYRAAMKENHKPYTLYHESMVVKQFLRWCTARGMLVKSPLSGYRLEKPKRVRLPAPSSSNVQQILLKVGHPQRLQLAILAFTGMRVGDLQKLRVGDVDLKGNWIHIVSRLGAETKTRESRKVPIHSVLRTMLAAHTLTGPWFFTAKPSRKYPQGGHWISPKKLNDRFVGIVKELGLPAGRAALGLTLHSLRRFFETECVHCGIPQRVIDAWMGHSSDKSMGAVYYSLSDEDSQRFMKQVSFEAAIPSGNDGDKENMS